jgi:hypothetical protein
MMPNKKTAAGFIHSGFFIIQTFTPASTTRTETHH